MGSEHTLRTAARAAALAALGAAAIAVAGCSGVSADDADLVAGKQLFVERCGSCHVLGRAGTKGNAGPNLDDAFAVARAEGWGDDAIRGAVHGQILNPSIGSRMPAKLVEGESAHDVAAYVGSVAARGGEDAGLLATAVKRAGGGAPAVAKNGVLTIAADPSGQLAYVTDKAEAPAGRLEVEMPNESSVPHNLLIERTDIETPIVTKSVAKAGGELKPGKYTYFCSVQGHREAGMLGELTVK